MVLKESKVNKEGRALTRGIVTMGTVGVLDDEQSRGRLT